MNLLLTNSSLTTFKTCPRKYQIQYEQGYIPVRESEPLYFGKLVHFGLEKWATNGKNIEATLLAVQEEFERTQNGDEYILVKVGALLEGYHARYSNEDFETVEVEGEFRAPLLNPETAQASRTFELGGKKDRILKKDGRYILLETKTTSEDIEDPAADYWKKLCIDSQVSTYFLGAQASGIEISTCLYDVIKKPTIRPKMVGKEVDPTNPKRQENPQEFYSRLSKDIAERPNFYFVRREVPRSATDLDEFIFDTWHVAQSLRVYQLKNKFPRYTNACKGNYGYCQYFKVCSGQARLEDETLFKKVDHVHQELNKTVEDKNSGN